MPRKERPAVAFYGALPTERYFRELEAAKARGAVAVERSPETILMDERDVEAKLLAKQKNSARKQESIKKWRQGALLASVGAATCFVSPLAAALVGAPLFALAGFRADAWRAYLQSQVPSGPDNQSAPLPAVELVFGVTASFVTGLTGLLSYLS